jgi:hypothetical protein
MNFLFLCIARSPDDVLNCRVRRCLRDAAGDALIHLVGFVVERRNLRFEYVDNLGQAIVLFKT